MKYVFIICALFSYLTGIAVAAPEKSQVMEMLEGRHWILDAEIFQRLGEGTDRVLIKIAEDKSLINYLRFRALEALSLFPTENAATFLETTAKKEFAPLARRGFEALERSFDKTQPERVKQLANHLLKHNNAQVRISAARFIRSVDTPRFNLFMKSEQDAWVRKASQK
jgi:HEAT repeat protein